MRALIQRVCWAAVAVDDTEIARIGRGLLVFLGVERNDDEARADALAARLLAYRVFPDAAGRMNLDLRAVAGGLLLVSQFTLAADTARGLRPGFSTAAEPELARRLYERMLEVLREHHRPIACGEFGANMQVSLCNDGPVTFLLQS
ncbi:MAG TPA: D-aminoacyl-tRNA deacylase [Pseudomonadales bacterium]|nr:D-aminoacyl-tRNA deacylase [Pseudomonadales bacterium]